MNRSTLRRLEKLARELKCPRCGGSAEQDAAAREGWARLLESRPDIREEHERFVTLFASGQAGMADSPESEEFRRIIAKAFGPCPGCRRWVADFDRLTDDERHKLHEHMDRHVYQREKPCGKPS